MKKSGSEMSPATASPDARIGISSRQKVRVVALSMDFVKGISSVVSYG
jgi:hypothetical protein